MNCREELDSMKRIGELVRDLPVAMVEESWPGTVLAAARQAAEESGPAPWFGGWKIPALATVAAAVCLLVWRVGIGTAPRPVEVRQAQAPKPHGSGEVGKHAATLAARGAVLFTKETSARSGEIAGGEAQPAKQDVRAEQARVAMSGRDLPPLLFEKPDLFLDLPILRDLDKLENFEAVLQASPAVGRGYEQGEKAGHG